MESLTNQPAQPTPSAPQQQTPVSPAPSKGLGIASLVLGICAIVTSAMFIGGIAGILAIIFGIIVIRRKGDKGRAIAGIITGSLGVLLTIAVIAVWAIAIPALQKNTRDVDRKNQVSLAVSDIVQFQTENQGQLPDPAELSQSYETATLRFVTSGEPSTEVAVYEVGKGCDGVVSSRAFRVTVKLENGEKYCQGS